MTTERKYLRAIFAVEFCCGIAVLAMDDVSQTLLPVSRIQKCILENHLFGHDSKL